MGTPEFAREALESLNEWDGCDILAAYTQPDRPCGRGRACKPSTVKSFALQHDIPVLQPENFKADATVAELAALKPDLLIVAAYGLILPQRVLDIARLGAINIHASLLPKYRGAAPIQRAILAGEGVTGITIMMMDAGLDTGDILLARSLGIGINESAQEIHDQLAELSGQLIIEALQRLNAGKLLRIVQNDSKATYAAKLDKSDGEIDWTHPAQDVHNRARAMHPWPGAYFNWQGGRSKESLHLVLTPGEIGPALTEPRPKPGTLLGVREGKLAIACSDREYLVPFLKPSGKKLMNAEAFAHGYLDDCCCLD